MPAEQWKQFTGDLRTVSMAWPASTAPEPPYGRSSPLPESAPPTRVRDLGDTAGIELDTAALPATAALPGPAHAAAAAEADRISGTGKAASFRVRGSEYGLPAARGGGRERDFGTGDVPWLSTRTGALAQTSKTVAALGARQLR
ncbi:hypothetical protein M2271_000358 [Streptomyces sp. LBL]|uniref:hypothetical protein n=1 Tax=Streptomyces sp. LBL TaxID=2940562 RepID=UPI0024763968|nr:hypothetical protein [Streptomyces sp. LBL]MDH6622571.1 hypothetical protein [Streptomyces sp. LBL]